MAPKVPLGLKEPEVRRVSLVCRAHKAQLACRAFRDSKEQRDPRVASACRAFPGSRAHKEPLACRESLERKELEECRD